MSADIRIGKSRDHRSRKNPASREAWIKAKRKNRPKQIYVLDETIIEHTTPPFVVHAGHWEKYHE